MKKKIERKLPIQKMDLEEPKIRKSMSVKPNTVSDGRRKRDI